MQNRAKNVKATPKKPTGMGYQLGLANLRISKIFAMNHLRKQVMGRPTTLSSPCFSVVSAVHASELWSQTPALMFPDVTEYHKLPKQIVIIAATLWIRFTIYKAFPYIVTFG